MTPSLRRDRISLFTMHILCTCISHDERTTRSIACRTRSTETLILKHRRPSISMPTSVWVYDAFTDGVELQSQPHTVSFAGNERHRHESVELTQMSMIDGMTLKRGEQV